MFEKVPSVVGEALKGVRLGLNKTLAQTTFGDVPQTIAVDETAFGHRTQLPKESTADGAGVAPPLIWSNLPNGTATVMLKTEDADSATHAPLAHAVTDGLSGESLPAGGMSQKAVGPAMGTTSFGKAGYLAPGPPSGRARHRHVIQVYALGGSAGLTGAPGHSPLVEALAAKVLAKGVLIGTCERP